MFPYLCIDDLDREQIARCRKIATLRWENHLWKDLNDLELLKSAQLFQGDPETGKSGITRAGVLLLGKRSSLLSVVPHHRTDLILRKVNLDRYDDRDFVDVNLVESYERIMAFVQKHLPDPFYLENTINISIRDAIFREVASNLLIHREYTNAFPAKLIIEQGQVNTENSSRPHGFGHLDPKNFSPYPKNPVIASFFRQIGRADELGSGMRKLMKYGKDYGGADPYLIEGDIFRMVIRVPEFGENFIIKPKSEVTAQVTAQVVKFCNTPKSAKDIMAELGLKHWKTFQLNYLAPLLESGFLERTIPDKPKSRMQQYRTTEKGQNIVEKKS